MHDIQEANTEAKIVEIQSKGFRDSLSDLEQDFEERVAILKTRLARGHITQQEFSRLGYEIYHENSQSQLALIRKYISIATNQEFANSLKRKAADILTDGAKLPTLLSID